MPEMCVYIRTRLEKKKEVNAGEKMTTYTFDKKLFLETIDKWVKDDEFVIFSTTPCGSLRAASKKVKGKTISFGFSQDAFENPDTISDILNSKIGGLIICKKSVLSKTVQKEMDEYQKKKVK